MKTPLQELMDYMEQNQYFIGNDLLAKYKELLEKDRVTLIEPIEVDYTFFEGCVVETDLYCFEASRIKNDDGTFYDDISVEVTIKKGERKDWKKEYWDNMNWFVGILNGNTESISSLIESVPEPEQREVFINMLKKLVEIGWMKEEN